MQIDIPQSKPGDIYLLFHDFPYDFSHDLPLSIAPGVCVDKTPQEWLDSAEQGLADYLLPGYSLPGMGMNNCCLRCFSLTKSEEKLTFENLLFIALLSLRLHFPLNIRIGGQFRVGNDDDRILDPKLYELSSPWSINSSFFYRPSDFKVAAQIVQRFIKAEELCFNRIITGLIFFSHVTLGQVKSYQLSILGLFAALEALFVPVGNKATTISKRISNFLSNFDFPDPMNEWIKNEYINRRHKLAHGIHDATFGTKLRPDRFQDFGRLHEICRLSLLGFFSLDNQKLEELSKLKGNSLQSALDKLSPAAGGLLNDQKCWAR